MAKQVCTKCFGELATMIQTDRGMCEACWAETRTNLDTFNPQWSGAGSLALNCDGYGRMDGAIILKRERVENEHGDTVETVMTNVPWRHIYHSPSGFEWGYYGSGPADLALNILAGFRPLTKEHVEMSVGFKLWDGTYCSPVAWNLHMRFKSDFIAVMDRAGGTIKASAIQGWIERHEG